MKKQRYDMRGMPDTVISLINTLTRIEETNQGRKLPTAFVVAKAVATLGGYESCPDCSGLIDKIIFNAPPENIPENKKLWSDISKQHVTNCSWLKLAKAGMINQAVQGATKKEIVEQSPTAKEIIAPIVNTIARHTEMPREIIEEKILEIPKPQSPVVKSKTPNTRIIKPKMEDKPPTEEGAEDKVVWEKINGVMVKKITKVGTVDASEKDDFSDPEKIKGWGSTMEQGVSMPDGFAGTKNSNIAEKKVSGKSMQGRVTQKDSNIDLIQHEHNLGDPVPTKLGKARVEKFKEENVGKSLMEIPFDK